METITIKKRYNINFLYFLILFVLSIVSSCTLTGDGISPAEDSGFDLEIFNYSDKQYSACSFYFGYTDINNNFIATDSLVYDDIVIYKKGSGPNYNEENAYSSTQPFDQNRKGLNKFGVWELKEEIQRLYINGTGIKAKVNFNGYNLTSDSNYGLNGRLTFRILENDKISW